METLPEVSLPAAPASVREARGAIAEIATKAGASPRAIEDIRLCVSEAVANVVRHAYARNDGDLTITVEQGASELTVIVRDDGVGLNAFQRDGDLGYGLRIIEQLAQRYAITSAPNMGTEVRMVFALDPD
jgi:anti-sigma regulatory factor (Ser/Thr protein kinase)